MRSSHFLRVALCAVILGVVGAWWMWSSARGKHEVAAPDEPTAPTEPEATPASTAPAVESDSRTNVAAETALFEVASAPPATTSTQVERYASVDARFVDSAGMPWSGVRLLPIAPKWPRNWKVGEGELSDADGRVLLRLALPEPHSQEDRPLREAKLELIASRAGCTSVARTAILREGETSHLGFIVLGPGVRVLGRAVDAKGNGIARARIGIAPALLEGDEGVLARRGSPTFQTTPGTSSASDGSFTLEGVAPGKTRVWAHVDGFRHAWSAPLDVLREQDLLGVSIVMTSLLPTDFVKGQVVGPDGTPVAHAALQYMEHWHGGGRGTQTGADANGRFEIIVEHDDSTYDLTAEDMQERFTEQSIQGVVPGTPDVVIRLLAKEQMLVRVRDVDGAPVSNAHFDVMSDGSREFIATSTTPGEYSIAQPGEPFILTVIAKGFRATRLGTRRAMLDPKQLPAALEIELQRAKLLRGRVTADGAPVAGARVHIAPEHADASGTVAGYRFRYLAFSYMDSEAITDADGRYQLDCDVKGGYDVDKGFWLRAMADGWAACEIGPVKAVDIGVVSDFDFALTHGGTIEGRVLLDAGSEAEGTIVVLNHADGFPMRLSAGKDGTFRADGLCVGKWQVLGATHDISSDRMTFSSAQFDGPIEWSCEVRAGETTQFDLDLKKP